MVDTDQLERKLSNLENQYKQLLLRLTRIENDLRELQTKFRTMKNEFTSYKDLVGHRKFG
jgi:chromosome segregation ATPase